MLLMWSLAEFGSGAFGQSGCDALHDGFDLLVDEGLLVVLE